MKSVRLSAIMVAFIVLQSDSSIAQTYLQKPTPIDLPSKLREQFKSQAVHAFSVDFDGDGLLDYIIQTEPDTIHYVYREFWHDSQFRVVKSLEEPFVEYDYRWFIDLDGDTIPEIISARGWSDGIDYGIYRQDLRSGKDSLLLLFCPVLLDSSDGHAQYLWGYAWDITDLLVQPSNKRLLISATFDHSIELDGTDEPPAWLKHAPTIIFVGVSTQRVVLTDKIRNLRWMTLEQVVRRSRR